MPVQVSDEESLAPFFAHIGEGGTLEGEVGESGEETYYGVGTKEWYAPCFWPLRQSSPLGDWY